MPDGLRIQKVLDLIATLRGPNGCPWDREQKLSDVLSDLVEESYELQWAGQQQNEAELKDEMGDVLFLLCFAVSVARDEGHEFTVDELAQHAHEKIKNRHPHVFGDDRAATAEESIVHWERMKAAERAAKAPDASVFTDMAGNLPPLRRAEKIQERAASVGFDWSQAKDVLAKLKEEINELDEVVESGDRARVQDELGDVLFSVVNLARFLKVDPDKSLNQTSHKFVSRFRHMESLIRDEGKALPDMTLAEMDVFWERSKRELG